MKKINYEKVLKQLIDEYPHELDKIEKIVTDANKSRQVAELSFDEIIKSDIWSSDEKARLLTFFGYNKSEHEMRYTDRKNGVFKTRDYLYTIEHNILSGFEALMKVYKDIESHRNGVPISKDDSYRDIFAAIIEKCKDENKVTYLKAILDNLTAEDIKRLIAPYYYNHIHTIYNGSIFINIIASKDLNLIKEYIDYVDDINVYLQETVATGDIEIVKLFLEKGADINYLPDEVVLERLTPLKTAIANNDYEMVKFLIDNGADVNLQVDSTNFINRLNNYQIEVFDRFNHFSPYYHRESFNEEDEKAKQLRYIRVSSPLEYAIKLKGKDYKKNAYDCSYKVYFKGETHNVKNDLLVDKNTVSEQVKNRGALVDLIFDKLEDKKIINYNDLINFTFITRDVEKFKKYKEYAIEYNYQFDFDSLFEMYFNFAYENDIEMVIPFMNLIAKYDKDSNLYSKLFNYYLNKKINRFGIYKFSVDDFNKELLNRIPEEKRKEICLIPYCKDIYSLKYLISLGFDINQTDEKGRNILYYLLCNRHEWEDLTEQEIELFNYLLDNLNISMKDKDNKTVLYYAMQKFNTKNEYYYARKEVVGTRSKLEKAVVVLISKMPKEEVCNDDITKALEGKLKLEGNYGEQLIYFECIYQYHKELFEALIDKGFVLSDKILNNMFESLYPKDEREKEILKDKINMDDTLDFLYSKLDRNVEIQKLDIEQEFNNLMFQIDREDITFDEFLENIKKFNNQIISLNQFYENNIKKRFNPERYLQYAKEKYNTVYANLDRYLLLALIKTVRKFGNEKLAIVLDNLPNYDINTRVWCEDIGLIYLQYLEQVENIIGSDKDGNLIYGDDRFHGENVYARDYDEPIEFSGGLIQYAILTDDLPLVKLLQEKGASLNFYIDGEDYTWDYVGSYTMLNYIESIIGKKKYSDLDGDEKSYYLRLINNADS